MTYYCKLCDKSILNQSKNKHFKTITHKSLDNSIIRRYIILNPTFDQVDPTIKNYFINYIKKYSLYEVQCLLKLLTTSIIVRYFRIKPDVNLNDSYHNSIKLILCRINKDYQFFLKYLK